MMRLAAILLVVSLASGLVAPALCAGTAPKAMPCCDPERDCGTGLGRPSCCLDAPAGGGAGTASPADTPSRVVDVTTTGPSAVADDPIAPSHAAFPEVHPAPGAAPPLFLLHASLLC